jgi:hypothetical protein
MVVSLVALVMASTGTAVAAVKFARNAGAVDGKSAVWASTGKVRAAGKLVTTRAKGVDAGRFPNRFVAFVPYTRRFARGFEVIDNGSGAAQTLTRTRLGSLTATCNDQRGATGVEDPSLTLSFANGRAGDLNYARETGTGAVEVVGVARGAQQAFTINGSNTFRVHVHADGVNVLYEGMVRQDGQGSASGRCIVIGVAHTIAQ